MDSEKCAMECTRATSLQEKRAHARTQWKTTGKKIAGWGKKRTRGEPVSRILSVITGMTGWPFLWDAGYPAPQATYPGVGTGRADPRGASLVSETPTAPLFGLAPGGVCRARPVTRPAGELLPHRFTLTARAKQEARTAVCFLWHYPYPCERWALPTTLPCGVRTFLPTHLSRVNGTAGRATTRLTTKSQGMIRLQDGQRRRTFGG